MKSSAPKGKFGWNPLDSSSNRLVIFSKLEKESIKVILKKR